MPKLVASSHSKRWIMRGDVMMLDKVKEGVKHKISILEEKYTNMDKRLMVNSIFDVYEPKDVIKNNG